MSPYSFSSTPESTATFTATGLNLAANTYYWIVGFAANGDLVWPYAVDNGSGPGFQLGWAVIQEGTIWNGWGRDAPYMMSVEATPVPAPAALLLFGSGLLSLVGLRRRTKA